MPKPTADAAPNRVASVDVYRGLVMTLMLAEVLRLPEVAKKFPDSDLWQFLGRQQSHVEWAGGTLHDMIQPSFSFLVGTALAFSLAKRKSQPIGLTVLQAAWRAFLLVALGIVLRSLDKSQTNYTFEDTLSQIGLGYLPLVLVALGRPWLKYAAVGVLLVGYWAAFALYPLPGPEFDTAAVKYDAAWPHHPTGFAAHWDKNTNAAWAFDTWFLNQLPREKPFTHNGGGYSTLSFIPTLATMLLGLIAGTTIRDRTGWPTVGQLLGGGAVLFAVGFALDAAGLCPIVKRIWTPSWTLASGGVCFATLAVFHAVCDVVGYSGWAYPLKVVGANSIVAYVSEWLAFDIIRGMLKRHLPTGVYDAYGLLDPRYAPLVEGGLILLVVWLGLWWMYRNRYFVRL